MGFYNNLCPGCMNEVGENEVCPYCEFNLNSQQVAPFLAYGTVLAGKYVVGDILEQNSEGITYLGLDTITNNCVRIREFFPENIADRDINETKVCIKDDKALLFRKFKTDFLELWHKLMRLRSIESLITVLDVFEANDTAYSVAEADGSQTLTDFIIENGGTLKWSDISSKLYPVMETLEILNNEGIIHGAISPDTLFLCSNGQFKPWGFGIEAIRKADGELKADLRPGYTALEQYKAYGQLSPATDVYGYIAVLYKCVTGHMPLDSEVREQEDTLSIPAAYARELPDFILAAFIGGLQVKPEDRTKDFARLKIAFTREGFERQKQQAAAVAGISLIDPISDFDTNPAPVRKVSEPVIVNGESDIPVLTKEVAPVVTKKTTSASSTILMSISIVLVMIIFFVCLTLTGIVSFNIGGFGTTAKVVEIPDFTNYSKTDDYISEVAEKYGLHIKLQATSSTEYAEGIIFDQDIAPGTKVERGSTINIYYSKGASTVTLPNFTGMTFTETVYYLGKLNLSYNIIEKKNTGNQTAGTVVAMSPAPNSVVYEGTEITIEIWGETGNRDVTGPETGSQITSSDSILGSIFGRLSDSVSGLSDTIQNFIG